MTDKTRCDATELEATAIRRIKYIIENDIGDREDALARARIEHRRGVLSNEELADYIADAELGKVMQKVFTKMERIHE